MQNNCKIMQKKLQKNCKNICKNICKTVAKNFAKTVAKMLQNVANDANSQLSTFFIKILQNNCKKLQNFAKNCKCCK